MFPSPWSRSFDETHKWKHTLIQTFLRNSFDERKKKNNNNNKTESLATDHHVNVTGV